jgi:hypothetical protein
VSSMSTAAEQIRQLRIRLSSPASSSRGPRVTGTIPQDLHGINILLGAIIKVVSPESVRSAALFPAFSSAELTTDEEKLLEAAGLRDRGEPSVVFLERIEESLARTRESSEKGVDDDFEESSWNRLKHIRQTLLTRSPSLSDSPLHLPLSRPQHHSIDSNDDGVDGVDGGDGVDDDDESQFSSPNALRRHESPKTEELMLRVEELESMENTLSSELLFLQKEREESRDEKAQLGERLRKTEGREKGLRDEKQRMTDRIRELEDREKSLENENEEMEERIREFDKRGEIEQKRMKDRLSQFEEGVRRSTQTQEERMEQRILELEETERTSRIRSKQMEKHILQLKERENSLIEENEFFMKKLKEQTARTEELVREKLIVEEECREIGAKSEQIESLRATDLQMFGTEMDDVQKKNEKLHHAVESMESTFAKMSQEVDSMQADKTDVQNKNEKLHHVVESMESTFAKMSEEVDSIQAEKTDVQNKNEKLHHVVESMESTFTQMSEEIDSIQAEKTDRDERIWTLSEGLIIIILSHFPSSLFLSFHFICHFFDCQTTQTQSYRKEKKRERE